MPAQFTGKESIPAVLKEMTIEEKIRMCNGGSHFGSFPLPRLGIPKALFTDAYCGVNLRHHLCDVWSTREVTPDDPSPTFGSLSQLTFIMDHLDDQSDLSDEEKQMLERFLAHLKEKYVASGEMPSCFPVNALMASSWDPEIIYNTACQVGKEASAYGVSMLLGTPCIDIQRDPRAGRGFECYSEDPFLTGELAYRYPLGVQEQGVIADMKHFAINNQETNRKTVNVITSERTIREIYLEAFRKCVQKGGVRNVMTSYNWINGVAASQNKWLLEDVLRGEWAFEGFVVSDWGGVYDKAESLKAGNDMAMPKMRLMLPQVTEAYEQGRITEADFDRCITRILTVMADMPCMKGRRYTDIDGEAGRRVAYEAAVNSMILLKNNGVLPLSAGTKVAFYGSGSKRFLESGVGSGRVHTTKTSSMMDTCAAITGAENVLFETVDESTKAVVVTIFAHGQEGSDRPDIAIPTDQRTLLDRAVRDASGVGAKVILVLNIAGPVELMDVIDNVDAILCVYFPGMEGGHAAGDLLFGKRNPSGKLTQSFPKYYRDCASYGNFPGENHKVYFGEGIYVGYRYFDMKGIAPLFPFGYGLSYTTFRLDDLRLNKDTLDLDTDDTIAVTVRVTNTGSMAGAEVVQLYLRDPVSTQPKPVKELKGFQKVYLEPGQSKDVTIEICKESLQSFDEELHSWVCEPGMYEVLVGTSAADIHLTGSFRAKGFNPYGYGEKTYYAVLAKDPRAVDVITSLLPDGVLTADDIARQTAYIDAVFTMRHAFQMHIRPKLPHLNDEEAEALLQTICKELGKIDITDCHQTYKETEIF